MDTDDDEPTDRLAPKPPPRPTAAQKAFAKALDRLWAWHKATQGGVIPKISPADHRDLAALLADAGDIGKPPFAVCRQREGPLSFENAEVVTLEKYQRLGLARRTLFDVHIEHLKMAPVARGDPTLADGVTAAFRGAPAYMLMGEAGGRSVAAYEAVVRSVAAGVARSRRRIVVLSPAPRFVVQGTWTLHGGDGRGLSALPVDAREGVARVCEARNLRAVVLRTRISPTADARVERAAYEAYAIAGDCPWGAALVKAGMPTVQHHSFLSMRTARGSFRLEVRSLSDDGLALMGFAPESAPLVRRALEVASRLIDVRDAILENSGGRPASHTVAQINEACGHDLDVIGAVYDVLAGYGEFVRGDSEFRWFAGTAAPRP